MFSTLPPAGSTSPGWATRYCTRPSRGAFKHAVVDVRLDSLDRRLRRFDIRFRRDDERFGRGDGGIRRRHVRFRAMLTAALAL